MIDIICYSIIELLTAFSPNYAVFLLLRGLFGVAMGGEWGLGSSLAMESLPTESRGLFSGILQQGYACGYLLGAIAYFLIFTLFPNFGWRGMFIIGVLPALLVVFIRMGVSESPVWEHQHNIAPRTRNQRMARHGACYQKSVAALSLSDHFNDKL